VASPSPDDHQAFLAGVKAEIQDFETSQRFRALEHRRALDDLGEIPPGLKPLADAERKYLADVEVEAARNRAMLATATSASTHLGVVYCSSGHGRTSGGSRDGCVLDWAAVEMDTARLGGGAPDEAVNVSSPGPINSFERERENIFPMSTWIFCVADSIYFYLDNTAISCPPAYIPCIQGGAGRRPREVLQGWRYQPIRPACLRETGSHNGYHARIRYCG